MAGNLVPHHAHAGMTSCLGTRGGGIQAGEAGPALLGRDRQDASVLPESLAPPTSGRKDVLPAEAARLSTNRALARWTGAGLAGSSAVDARWMRSWTTWSRCVDGQHAAGGRLSGMSWFSTARPVSFPQFDGAGPRLETARPPSERTGRSAAIHDIHTMMMVMTDIEE